MLSMLWFHVATNCLASNEYILHNSRKSSKLVFPKAIEAVEAQWHIAHVLHSLFLTMIIRHNMCKMVFFSASESKKAR